MFACYYHTIAKQEHLFDIAWLVCNALLAWLVAAFQMSIKLMFANTLLAWTDGGLQQGHVHLRRVFLLGAALTCTPLLRVVVWSCFTTGYIFTGDRCPD